MSDKQDKTFDPTPRRLQKAREEGNVFRSKEIVSAGMLLIGVGVLVLGTPAAFQGLRALTARIFLSAATTSLTVRSVPELLSELGVHLAGILLPFFLALVVAGIGLNVGQSGWNMTFKPLAPKGNRLSPLQGLKRIFGVRGLFEFGKALAKIAVVAPFAYLTISSHLGEILLLHTLPIQGILKIATEWIVALLAQMILMLLVLAGLDFAFEKWRYKRDLKMSQREIRDEAKESEGDPQVKGKRRQIARQLLNKPRLDHAVLQANVVVTNPTHYAVALRYNPEESAAPRVLAKGIRKRALRIKQIAHENEIPTVENRPLARALYASVEVEQEIPEELYAAVAAVLAEVFRQRERQERGGDG